MVHQPKSVTLLLPYRGAETDCDHPSGGILAEPIDDGVRHCGCLDGVVPPRQQDVLPSSEPGASLARPNSRQPMIMLGDSVKDLPAFCIVPCSGRSNGRGKETRNYESPNHAMSNRGEEPRERRSEGARGTELLLHKQGTRCGYGSPPHQDLLPPQLDLAVGADRFRAADQRRRALPPRLAAG